MQDFVARIRHSASTRVVAIGVLILLLLIPLSMVQSVIIERSRTSDEAMQEVQRSWGGEQLVAGPVLIIPYDVPQTTAAGVELLSRRHLFVLPENLHIDADLAAEARYRGIYEVPVYSSRIGFRGNFPAPQFDELQQEGYSIDWAGALLAVAVSDGRALSAVPELRIAGQQLKFIPGGNGIAGLPPQILAPVGKQPGLALGEFTNRLQFDFELALNGSVSLRFLPAGDTTEVSLRSSWPAPSFSGNYLPESHDIDADGFTAQWKVSSIGRALPSRWSDASGLGQSAQESAFGVALYMPISVYRLTERATKYGILFIGLTFVTYFLFEVIAGLRLHPLQYLLVGFANSLFYLLLISLAEHIGFAWSYLLSSLASCALIVGYSRSVLGNSRHVLVVAVVLGLLYGLLYMTLRAETYALLAGSIGLWVALALMMFLTRRIDWYGKDDVPG